MKLTKSKIKKLIRESLLKEGTVSSGNNATHSVKNWENIYDDDPWDEKGPTPEYIDYVKSSDPLMKSYSKKDNPFFRMLNNDLKIIKFI